MTSVNDELFTNLGSVLFDSGSLDADTAKAFHETKDRVKDKFAHLRAKLEVYKSSHAKLLIQYEALRNELSHEKADFLLRIAHLESENERLMNERQQQQWQQHEQQQEHHQYGIYPPISSISSDNDNDNDNPEGVGNEVVSLSGSSSDGTSIWLRLIYDMFTSEEFSELAKSYIETIKASSGNDISVDISEWFHTKFPNSERGDLKLMNAISNFKQFLIRMALQLYPMIKMFRIGLGFRLFVVAGSSYVDMVTDILVTHSFFSRAMDSWGQASLGCVTVGIFFQALFAWMQYHRQGYKKCAVIVFFTFLGILPLIEAWTVFRGTPQSSDMAMNPVIMLAVTKGLEIMFESLPESIIQSITMLSSDYLENSAINYLGLASSVFSAGLIMTDANHGMARSQQEGSPKNPFYNFLPKQKRKTYTCITGFFFFTTFYFASNVFTLALVYLYFGSHIIMYAVIAEASVIMLYEHFVDGELFAFSLMANPSTLDYVVGPVVKFVYYILSFVTYAAHSKNPPELGPHVTSTLIIWRMVTNTAVVNLILPSLGGSVLPWLSYKEGLALYLSFLLLSILGAYIYWGYMDEKHERWRWFKRQTGRQHILENWNSTDIWEVGCKTKDEGIVSWILGVHPIYLDINRMLSWVCVELIEKYGTQEVSMDDVEEGARAPPHWMTEEWKNRMTIIFSWYGQKDAIADANASLSRLPTFISPMIMGEKNKSGQKKRRVSYISITPIAQKSAEKRN